MHFRRRFLFPVFCPVHALGYQLDGRGINYMDRPLETPWQSRIMAPAGNESGIFRLDVVESRPKQFLSHLCVSGRVGMGQAVSARRDAVADLSQISGMKPEAIADVVQTERMA